MGKVTALRAPRTYCAARVAALSSDGVDRADGDPLDICVISERPITRSEILLSARVVGGIKMIDDGEADDKIVAVLDNDPFWYAVQELASVPKYWWTALSTTSPPTN